MMSAVVRRDAVGLTALAAAMAFVFVSGVASDDMLKVYAGTLRIIDGQLPYRDFLPQNVPLANALAAPVFAALPTIGSAALTLAVALNVAATLLMYGLIFRLTGDCRASVVGGLLMALWYCQIGGYYFDEVTYLLGLAAFARYVSRPESAAVGATEGLLLACGGLAKQTVGTFVFAAFVVTVVLLYGWKPLLHPRFWGGLLAPVVILCAYLAAIDGWQGLYTSAILQPAEYADYGVSLWRVATDFLRPWNLDIIAILRERRLGQLSFYPLVLGVYLSYLAVALGVRQGRLSRTFAGGYLFLLLSTVWAAATPGRLYAHVTFGFPGIVGLTVHAVSTLPNGMRAALGRWAALTAIAVFGGIAVLQATVNLYRDGWQRSPVATQALWPLAFDQRQIETMTAAASIGSGTYALFGEPHLNVAPLSLGHAPSDPVLFYEYRVTIPFDQKRRQAWQAMVIASFEARQPDFLLVAFFSSDEPPYSTSIMSMEGLPQLQAYFEQTYPRTIGRSSGVTLYARSAASQRAITTPKQGS